MSIKILLDECLPMKLKYRIEELDPAFFAKTVPDAGWPVFPTLVIKAHKPGQFVEIG